jgi:hypothetical protein
MCQDSASCPSHGAATSALACQWDRVCKLAVREILSPAWQCLGLEVLHCEVTRPGALHRLYLPAVKRSPGCNRSKSALN